MFNIRKYEKCRALYYKLKKIVILDEFKLKVIKIQIELRELIGCFSLNKCVRTNLKLILKVSSKYTNLCAKEIRTSHKASNFQPKIQF